MVERLVTIKPRSIRLTGRVGQPVKTEVLILPERKHFFKIVDVSAHDGKNIHFSTGISSSPDHKTSLVSPVKHILEG